MCNSRLGARAARPLLEGAGCPRSRLLLIFLCCLLSPPIACAQDPFADSVVSFTPGTHAGFGADQLPGIVLGPPRGAGLVQGSFDVVSLGNDGVIVIGFALPVICDGPGADFTVFENAFHSGSPSGPIFSDYGIVAASQDGEHFVDLPYDPQSHAGLAGQSAVLSNPDNMIDPLDPSVSGGDVFDLASTGLSWAAYVRITDAGAAIPDPGNQIPQADNSGFDLDAIAALHGCDPSALASATPTPSPQIGATATHSPTPEDATPTMTLAIATASATAVSPTVTATIPSHLPGDLNGDGSVTDADAAMLIAELYDGDGDTVPEATAGGVDTGSAADVNGDGRITSADLAALSARRSD
jgi:Dockerin type I domain